MKQFYLFFPLCFLILSCSVASFEKENSRNTEGFTLATWNVQTFFDSEFEGTEYSDFQNLSKWSKDKYMSRLSRLCEVMSSINADVFVLEEIENVAVVQDIANQMTDGAWSKENGWSYACFSKISGSAIGCAVFSRLELKDMKIHTTDIQVQNQRQPSARPLIQVTLSLDGKDLELFVNHWKSKSGGEVKTEIWRDWQEMVLANRLKEMLAGKSDASYVLCGDFNRDIKDFVKDGNKVLLRGSNSIVHVISPWLNSSGNSAFDTGSYYYDGAWEKIDHIFSAGRITVSAFRPRTDGVWCSAGGVPNAYKLYSGEGYSDHLPLMCVISFE